MDGGGGHDVAPLACRERHLRRAHRSSSLKYDARQTEESPTALRIGYSYKDIGGYRLSVNEAAAAAR